MNQVEKVTLAMLVTLGATAMDSGLMEETRKKFEDQFGVVVTDEAIVNVINKVKATLSGTETVIIEGD